jgi:hypothetical protein
MEVIGGEVEIRYSDRASRSLSVTFGGVALDEEASASGGASDARCNIEGPWRSMGKMEGLLAANCASKGVS